MRRVRSGVKICMAVATSFWRAVARKPLPVFFFPLNKEEFFMPEEFVKQREGCRNEQGAACDAIKRVSGLELQHLTTLPGKMKEHNVRSCYCHGTAIPSLLCVWGDLCVTKIMVTK